MKSASSNIASLYTTASHRNMAQTLLKRLETASLLSTLYAKRTMPTLCDLYLRIALGCTSYCSRCSDELLADHKTPKQDSIQNLDRHKSLPCMPSDPLLLDVVWFLAAPQNKLMHNFSAVSIMRLTLLTG
ncbi:hypothetical protein MY4038_006439 [Beauveria bassiana]